MYSMPAVAATNALWGDVAGFFVDGAWEPPDNRIDITDTIAVLNKFSNLPGAPSKVLVDLVGNPADPTPDLKVTISDVLFCLRGFAGSGNPFSPDSQPCD